MMKNLEVLFLLRSSLDASRYLKWRVISFARKAIEKMEQDEAKRLAERQARIDSVLQVSE